MKGSFGFIGALIPLSLDVTEATRGFIAIFSGYFVLAAMGSAIGSISSGNRHKWMAALIFLGIILTVVKNLFRSSTEIFFLFN